jgi:hypothetical protein
MNEAFRQSVKREQEIFKESAKKEGEIVRLKNELAAAKAELAACKEDAERYRWLVGHKIYYSSHGDGMAWAIMNWCVEVYSMAPGSLAEAIDAARKDGA